MSQLGYGRLQVKNGARRAPSTKPFSLSALAEWKLERTNPAIVGRKELCGRGFSSPSRIATDYTCGTSALSIAHSPDPVLSAFHLRFLDWRIFKSNLFWEGSSTLLSFLFTLAGFLLCRQGDCLRNLLASHDSSSFIICAFQEPHAFSMGKFSLPYCPSYYVEKGTCPNLVVVAIKLSNFMNPPSLFFPPRRKRFTWSLDAKVE